jgi:hypothetical protein
MIEAKTKYTKKSFREFQWFHSYKRNWSSYFMVAFVFIMFAGAAFIAVMSVINDEYSDIFLSVVLVVLGVFLLVLPRLMTWFTHRKSPWLFEMGNAFSFRDDSFTAISNSDLITGTSDIKYEALAYVYETSGFFYVYIQAHQSFMIDKKDFTAGTPEDLSALLQRVLPPKKFVRKVK